MTKDEVLASVLDALENHIEDPRQARLIDSLIKDITSEEHTSELQSH